MFVNFYMLRYVSITGLLFAILISSNINGEEMSEVTEEQKMHQYMGIEMNIQTWNLLGKKTEMNRMMFEW